ncbi:MAG TPA: XdhC/CoxI family protein [Polyangiaceae bacterium]|nr:XdhC/CoxI family protein [Polyangiaceae bacterium]
MAVDAESVLEIAETWCNAGQRVAWATVVSTWRSSPRPLGSQLLIAQDGRFAGSVSGGCVEGAVIQAASELFRGAPAQLLSYGVSSEAAWEVGLPCGGKIEIVLAELGRPLLERLLEARRNRNTIACLTELGSRQQELWAPGLASQLAPAGHALGDAVAQAFRDEQNQIVEGDGQRLFVQLWAAPLRLVVIGAVHLTQVLGELAAPFGFELIVVDPRTAFATHERFPNATLVHDWPDLALAQLGLDRRSAVVVLSHDAKLDEPALLAALRSDCFYVGALGSQRTQQARRHRLAAEGLSEAALARIHGPIGLDIGALTTPEIAVAILAEIIQARRKPEPARAGPL